MSRIPNYPYSADGDDTVFSSPENLHHGVQTSHDAAANTTSRNPPRRLSGEWSTRMSSSSSSRRDGLPPTRSGPLKPGDDHHVVDPLRLVKAETNPLVNEALETIKALETQKHPETKTSSLLESCDLDWEQNLSSWKDRRKSKPTYQPKALEIEDQGQEENSAGKRSKTYKELMEEKEKRSNGYGLYNYEEEGSKGLSRDISGDTSRDASRDTSRDAAAAPTSKTTTISSTTVPARSGREVPSKTSDPVASSSSSSSSSSVLPSSSNDRQFYFTDSFLEGASGDDKTGLFVPGSDPETGTLLVQQKPLEITLEFQTSAEVSATETKVLMQKTPTAIDPSATASHSESQPWRSTDRRTSETTSASTVGSSGVKLREKPAGETRPRPSSYAFTGHRDALDAKTDALQTSMRPHVAAQVTLGSTRGTALGRPPSDRYVDPPREGLTKDRRVSSNWELNVGQSFEKNERPEFKPQPKSSIGISSSAKFKQALSLFQSKEAEAGQQPPPPPTKAPLTTQRSIGRIGRFPVEETSTKPVRATAVETKRVITTDAAHRPPTETQIGYQTEANRLRESSRSAQGLDNIQQVEPDEIPDRKSATTDRSFKYDVSDDKYNARNYDVKRELSDVRSCSPSRGPLVDAHSSGGERAQPVAEDVHTTRNLETGAEKASASRVELEVSLPKSRMGVDRDVDQNEKIGVGSNVSWTLKLGDGKSAPSTLTDISCDGQSSTDTAQRHASGIHPEVRSEFPRPNKAETRARDVGEGGTGMTVSGGITVPDWRMDQRRDSLNRKTMMTDPNEPKSLYAFKYQTSNSEESIVEGRDKGQTRPTDFKAKNYAENPSESKYNLAERESLQAENNAPSGLRAPYNREKGGDTGSSRRPAIDADLSTASTTEHSGTSMSEKSVSDSNSLQRNRPTQQPSISDIFSRRSTAAIRDRSPADERKAQIDEEKKSHQEFQDGGQLTKHDASNARSFISDVDRPHDDQSLQKQGSEAKEWRRLPGYGESDRRHYGLQRISDAHDDGAEKSKAESEKDQEQEPGKREAHHRIELRQESAFEVDFSSSGLKRETAKETNVADKDRLKFSEEQLETKIEGDRKTSSESENALRQHRNQAQEPGNLEVTAAGGGGHIRTHHEDFGLEENVSYLALDMKLVELDASSTVSVNDKDPVNLNRTSNDAFSLSFSETDVAEFCPETKQREDDLKYNSFLDKKTQNASSTSKMPLHTSRSRSPNESSPSSPVCRSPSPETLSSPVPPPLPAAKPPLLPRQSPAFEIAFTVPPPTERMPSPEPVSPGPVSPGPVSPPIERMPTPQPASPGPVRSDVVSKLIDFEADHKTNLPEFSESDSSKAEKSLTTAEFSATVDGDINYSFGSGDRRSNIPFDQTSISSRSTDSLHQESPTVSLSVDQKIHENPALSSSTSAGKEIGLHQTNGVVNSNDFSPKRPTIDKDILGGAVAFNLDTSKGNSPPKKKPPEVPKTKPKPKVQKSSDDWSFLSNTQLLDTSVNRDKCRLTREGPMSVRKRPKSALIPSLQDMTDLFSPPSGVQRGVVESGGGVNGVRENAINGEDVGAKDRDPSARQSEETAALRLKASLKGPRPVSYIGELNSSLAKKFKASATAFDPKEHERNRNLKDESENVAAAAELTTAEYSHHSSYGESSDSAAELSKEKVKRSKSGVKIPGLMDELNLSFKKKFQGDSEESSDKKAAPTHSILQRENADRIATGFDAPAVNLDTAADDDNDEKDGEVAPPPLPDAPPPLPNWTSFPGDGPPSGPPPPLIDLDFSGEENSGRIQFVTDASGSRDQTLVLDQKWRTEEKSKKNISDSKSEEMDFSFA